MIILGGVCACIIFGIVTNKLAKQMSETKRQQLFAKTILFNVIICVYIIYQNISSFSCQDRSGEADIDNRINLLPLYIQLAAHTAVH